MAKSLAEYAAENPATAIPEDLKSPSETARSYQDRMDEKQKAEDLMRSILTRLKRGDLPQYILFTAVDVIGLLTHDTDWHDEANGLLCELYQDIAQQSLLRDNEAIAEERLADLQASYNKILRKNLTRNLSKYKEVADALNKALDALNVIEQAEQA